MYGPVGALLEGAVLLWASLAGACEIAFGVAAAVVAAAAAVVAVAVAAGVARADGEGDADAEGVGVGEGSLDPSLVSVPVTLMLLLMRLTRQFTADPPTLAVPLHWLTVTGTALLTLDLGSTVQFATPPPPFAEPLHCVIAAPLVGSGNGVQAAPSGPPLPDPTHWLTVALAIRCGLALFCSILFVIFTLHSTLCAASLSESLHCRTEVTRPVERVVKLPLGVEQRPSVHSRVTVVSELVAVALIVLTTVTVHVSAVVAPSGPGPWPLHWSTAMLEAWAAVGRANPTIENDPASRRSAITAVCQERRDGGPVGRIVLILICPTW